MAGMLDAFVKTVIGHTITASWREMADYHRRALFDVLERNVCHLDDVLDALSADRYSMSAVSVLYVKMNQTYTEVQRERFERTLSQIESLLPFFDSMQISFIPDIYVSLFRKVYELCLLHINAPSRGISLLTSAITVLVGEEKDMLTSLHPCLFCLCLKTRSYDPAQQFLHLAISKILKENTNQGPYVEPKWVLLYFYYGGLLYMVKDHYEEAFAMMQKACSIPAVEPSAIMVQAYKKYILLSLMLYEKALPLPNYRSPVIARGIIPYCADYTALQRICNTDSEDFDKAAAILDYLNNHRATFERDQTVGMVKLAARKIRENSVKKLTQCFMSISLSDIARRCHLDDCNHAQRYLHDMNREKKISVRIDEGTGFAYFDEVEIDVDMRKVEEASENVNTLDGLMRQFDSRIRVNPAYISRTGRPAGARAMVAIPPDEGLGYPGTAFMPNFNVGGIESAAGRSMEVLD